MYKLYELLVWNLECCKVQASRHTDRNGNLRTGHYFKFGFSILLYWAICKSLLWESHFCILLFNVLPRDTATGKVLKWHEKLMRLKCKFEAWEHSTYLLFVNIHCCLFSEMEKAQRLSYFSIWLLFLSKSELYNWPEGRVDLRFITSYLIDLEYPKKW